MLAATWKISFVFARTFARNRPPTTRLSTDMSTEDVDHAHRLTPQLLHWLHNDDNSTPIQFTKPLEYIPVWTAIC